MSNKSLMDFIIIKKIVSALLYPLGMSGVLLASAMIVSLFGPKSPWLGRKGLRSGWKSLARCLCGLAILILLFASNPKFAAYLTQSLEQQYPQLAISQVPKSDAIVILGGMVRLPLPPAQQAQLGSRAERLWYGTQLYLAGKAPKVMLTGGNVFHQPGVVGEAHYAAEIIQAWGVAQDDIIVETSSRTTAQNAEYIASKLQKNDVSSVLLVTSALHLPRAIRHFQALPLTLIPAPADILVSDYQRPSVLHWIPSASALALTTAALHEYYGLGFIWLQSLFG